MTRKNQLKILNDKIESNTNQYKVDRLNAEISAFSSDDLNKYEFLARKDLKYKPNALDKARFEFSPLRKAFRTGLDKTAESYQEEGVIKLLKDTKDGLRSGRNRPDNDDNDDNDDDDNDDNDDNDDDNDDNDDNDMPDLETEEDAAKRIAGHYDYLDKINKFKNGMENNMDNFDEKFKHKENKIYDKLNRLRRNKIEKINNYIKENNDKKVDIENKLNVAKDQYNNLLLEYNQSKNELMEIKDKLHKAGDNNMLNDDTLNNMMN